MTKATELSPTRKTRLLRDLAEKRKSTRWPGYGCIGDYYNGAYECDFVSPYSKTACNVTADIFVLLQDWTSEESILQGRDEDAVRYGRTLWLPTNRRLSELLRLHFNVDLAETYSTNLFPFVKKGGISASIPMRDLVRAAREFAIPQIQIIGPKLVICVGLMTFNALRVACGYDGVRPLGAAVKSRFSLGKSMVWCQAHTGARGQNTRGRNLVMQDWTAMKADFEAQVHAS